MTLKAAVAELCKAIHRFETEISPLKEQLFNLPIVTSRLLWNHAFGERQSKADASQLSTFFSKHGLALKMQQINLVIWVYSSRKDQCLSQDDFWQIFKPLTIKFVGEINRAREQRYVVAKCHEIHYKIIDLVCQIFKKTVVFLTSSNQIKKKIVKADPEQMSVDPLEPSHLQIYINSFADTLLLQDVELVFSHIMRNQQACEKTLKEYLIPVEYGQERVNPNYLYQGEQAGEMKGVELTKYHISNVKYVKSYMKHKPLYLEKVVRR